MALSNFYLTDEGNALLAKAQTGVALTITRAQIGEGIWPSGTNYANIKALVTPVKDLSIVRKTESSGQAKITVQFSNSGVGRKFQWREFALWAADPDSPDDREKDILYGTSYAGDSPIPIESALTEFIFNVIIKTGSATNITVVIDGSLIYLSEEDFDRKIDELKGKPNGIASLDENGKVEKDQIPNMDQMVDVEYTDGAIVVSGTIVVESGTIVKMKAPCNSEDAVNGLKINGVQYEILNSMMSRLSGEKNVWIQGATLAFLIDKEGSAAYLLSGGVSEESISDDTANKIAEHNEDPDAHPAIQAEMIKATIQVTYNKEVG